VSSLLTVRPAFTASLIHPRFSSDSPSHVLVETVTAWLATKWPVSATLSCTS
jgi:hypothetical protein